MKFLNRAIIFISLCIYCKAALAQDNTFFITYFRRLTANINEVVASCLDERKVPISDVQYFRNREIFNGGYVDKEGTLTVIFTRATEGNISCGRTRADGTVTMSSSVPILALPNGHILVDTTTSYATIRDQARVNCSIQPSTTFRSQYGVRWVNASDTTESLYTLFPASTFPPTRKSPRYDLDPTTFSLLIDNVQPLDSITPYVCVLSVRDIGSNPQLYTFEQTEAANLTLDVIVPPAFTLFPTPVTIAEGRQKNATFQCEIQSSPEASQIVWFYMQGDVEVQIRESSDYHIENSTISEGGTKVTHGMVTFINVGGYSSTRVRCEAQYVAFMDNRRVILQRQSASTTLAVLSRPTDLLVIPAENGGYIFRISLSNALPVPVAVTLRYEDSESGHMVKSTQNEMFMKTNSITIYKESVPYQRFQVKVGVIHEDVRSQMFGDGQVYDKSNAEKQAVVFEVISACELFIIVILLVLLITAICTGAMENCCKSDDEGHKASRLLSRVNTKRRVKLATKMLQRPARSVAQAKRRGSQNENLVHLDALQSDSAAEHMSMTTSGFTDELAKSYVEALSLAVKFGKDDPKIKRLLLQDEQMNSLDK